MTRNLFGMNLYLSQTYPSPLADATPGRCATNVGIMIPVPAIVLLIVRVAHRPSTYFFRHLRATCSMKRTTTFMRYELHFQSTAMSVRNRSLHTTGHQGLHTPIPTILRQPRPLLWCYHLSTHKFAPPRMCMKVSSTDFFTRANGLQSCT